jgi:hypothetical protein
MDPVEYVASNKEWIFSGVGVAVLISLGTWLRGVFRRPLATQAVNVAREKEELKQAALESPPSGPPARITRIAPLSFEDIMEALSTALPLQKQEVAEHYRGLNVEWPMLLYAAEKREKGMVSLHLDFGPQHPGIVSCEVPLDEYKELGILPKGAPITVIGEIERVDRPSVRLINVQLLIHRNSSGAA